MRGIGTVKQTYNKADSADMQRLQNSQPISPIFPCSFYVNDLELAFLMRKI